MSSFEKQPLKVLLAVAESLITTDFDYESPWDEADENYKIFNQSTSWINIPTEIEDMEFMAAFINENREVLTEFLEKKLSRPETLSQLVLPKLKRFNVWYEIWGPATLTEKYKTIWKSYDRDWVRDSLRYSYNDGSFDYWQGDYEEHETDNFEVDNFDITNWDELTENTKPILDKLVVENTKDLLDDLDKDTLIQLRNLINQKLGLKHL